MNKLLISVLLIVASSFAQAQEAFSTLEEQMTGKEFQETGLTKLSAEELKNLNAWIQAHSLATLDSSEARSYTQGSDDRGFENQRARERDADRSVITARIKGSFSGWDGHTVFELDNGMIWEQADGDTFVIREIDNPEVTIKPGAFRTWRLQLVGYGSSVKVKRLQ